MPELAKYHNPAGNSAISLQLDCVNSSRTGKEDTG
eukprot:SAG31_NODE_26808_length_436_cov_0.765579_2_plen_34_part_01